MLEPSKRLGAGPKGSANDYAALKALPLFQGIDFEKIYNSRPVIHDISSPYKKKRSNSGDDEFFNIEYGQNDDSQTQKSQFANKPQSVPQNAKLEETKTVEKTQILKPQPVLTVILSGLVQMKTSWFFYSMRRLTL